MGFSPLPLAAQTGNLVAVQTLIELGVELESVDEAGWTALHWAAQTGNLKIAEVLLEKGANPDCRNNEGRTPLHGTALFFVQFSKCGCGVRCSASADAASNNDAAMSAVLVERGASVNCQTDGGHTPLHIACFGGHSALVGDLVKCVFPSPEKDMCFVDDVLLSCSHYLLRVIQPLPYFDAQIGCCI